MFSMRNWVRFVILHVLRSGVPALEDAGWLASSLDAARGGGGAWDGEVVEEMGDCAIA